MNVLKVIQQCCAAKVEREKTGVKMLNYIVENYERALFDTVFNNLEQVGIFLSCSLYVSVPLVSQNSA